MKTIQEVFKDCENISSILNCEIENMNLYKKSNKLELKLISRQKINIKDISIFETYLKKKFQLEKIVIEVSYQEAVEYNIQEEWNGIANYIGESYPAAKAILTNSKVQVLENKLELTLNKAGIRNQLIYTTDRTHYWNLVYQNGSWRHYDATPGGHLLGPATDEEKLNSSSMQGRKWSSSFPKAN